MRSASPASPPRTHRFPNAPLISPNLKLLVVLRYDRKMRRVRRLRARARAAGGERLG